MAMERKPLRSPQRQPFHRKMPINGLTGRPQRPKFAVRQSAPSGAANPERNPE
jgi:hypothetical protein